MNVRCCCNKRKCRLVTELRKRAGFFGMTDDEVLRSCKGTFLIFVVKLRLVLEDLRNELAKPRKGKFEKEESDE